MARCETLASTGMVSKPISRTKPVVIRWSSLLREPFSNSIYEMADNCRRGSASISVKEKIMVPQDNVRMLFTQLPRLLSNGKQVRADSYGEQTDCQSRDLALMRNSFTNLMKYDTLRPPKHKQPLMTDIKERGWLTYSSAPYMLWFLDVE